jgi:hypothetical protein
VDAPGNDDNASMPEEVKRPNPWRKMTMMMMMMMKNNYLAVGKRNWVLVSNKSSKFTSALKYNIFKNNKY